MMAELDPSWGSVQDTFQHRYVDQQTERSTDLRSPRILGHNPAKFFAAHNRDYLSSNSQ